MDTVAIWHLAACLRPPPGANSAREWHGSDVGRMYEISRWLDALRLGKYAPLFHEQEIDLGVIPDLDERLKCRCVTCT